MTRIGVIGAGRLATALARRLGEHGHGVMLSAGGDVAATTEVARRFGAVAGTPAEAAAFGDVVALAVPWAAVPDALAAAGTLDGKVVWDCTNPLNAGADGLVIGTTTSGGEQVAALVPMARVVKGVPPFAELLHSDDQTIDGRPVGVFVAGDDPEATGIVAGLMELLPSRVTDAGGLDCARLIEPAMCLLVRLAYRERRGPRIALDLIEAR